MKFISRQKFILISFLILTGNCLLGYAIYHSNQELLESEKWVRHTEQVIAQTINIFSTAKDIKINSRDFALTNDTALVRSLNISGSTVFSELDKLKQLTVDNPAQQKRIDSLRFLMHKCLDFALKIAASRIKNGLIIADINSSAQNDKYYTTPILKITDAIQQEEKKLLEQRKEANKKNEKVFNRLSVFVFLLMAGFTIVLLYTIRKYLRQNDEKEKRAAELVIANAELSFQNDEKEKRADELVIANKELSYQSGEKKKRAGELVIAKKELSYQSGEKEKRAAELVIADEELLYQSDEKEKRAAELVIANVELLFQNEEKEKRAAELAVANIELLFQNNEKEKRADELIIANEELWYQNEEKEKRAAELVIANVELFYQNKEKEKRAEELAFANEELIFQNDIRKVAERNLLQSESRLKEAQAITHIGNFEVNMENYSETWSDEMYKIFGIKKGENIPSKELFLSFIHPDDADDVKNEMDEAAQKLQRSSVNFRFIRKDGVIRYGCSEAMFELGEKGELMRIYGIVQDVTERILGEQERAKIVSDLVLRNSDLEQFAYIISHNLRAPVANIIGASTALNDKDISDEDKHTLNKAINISVIKLDDVVQDLNHILQVKSNINATKEMVGFSTLVEDIKTSIKNIVTRADVNIKCDFSAFEEFLTIKSYMYSIFYNLISNSVKYCQPRIPCSIQIQSIVVKNTLQLIFTDNGLGINMEKKGDQVFGLYKRFHENTEGKGMGLYMVKTQVEILGGKISIKSEENVGTEFIIEFILND